MIISLISSLLFYVLPIFLGRPIVRFIYKRNLTYPFISYFMAGSLLLYASLLATFALKTIIPLFADLTLIQEVVFFLSFILLPLNFLISKDDFDIQSYLLPIATSSLFAGIAFSIWQFHGPYSFNWDLYEHQTLINTILGGNLSLIPSRLTDTFGFNGYSTLFHSLVAASQAFFQTSILSYWTTISFIHLGLAIFASYLLTKELTNNKLIAIIASAVTAFAFDSSISYTTLFFIPQTFTALLFVFLITQLISEAKNGRIPAFLLFAVSSFFIFINHYIVGFLGASIYIASYLYIKFSHFIEEKINIRTAIMAGFFLCLAGILFSSYIPLGFINSGEAQDYSLTLLDKFNIMKQSYGYLFLLFVPLGIFSALMSKKRIEILGITILVFLVSIVLMQFPYTVKFFTLAKLFSDAFIAIGIYYLLRQMNKFFKSLSVIVLLVVLSGIFTFNAISWKGILAYKDSYTQVSPEELQASEFLKGHYRNTQTLIVSDPATQNILEPLSTINSQGGAYSNKATRETLDEVSKTDEANKISSLLYKINDKIDSTNGKRLFVLSGRYFLWQRSLKTQKMAFSYNIWGPTPLTLENIVYANHLLSDPEHFSLVYSNSELVILEVKK